MIRIGVIGYGYWGPNIVRNFSSAEGAELVVVCDKNPDVLKKVARNHSGVKTVTDWREVTEAPDIDAVAVVTPVSFHYPLAKSALENGKHVFVEKPFTESSEHARELMDLAAKKNLKIMVDHTFLFTGAVRKMKETVKAGELGTVLYYDSTRVNLGLFQHDVNVIWDLAPHDFSIMDYVVGEKPVAVSACGSSHFYQHENVAYITVFFDTSLIAHFNVNWLSPVKLRTTLIGGEKKMLVWNDVSPDDKIKIYDKGVAVSDRRDIHELLVSYRSGDMYAPRLEQTEALKLGVAHFLECVDNGKQPICGPEEGLLVVRLLEACEKSVKAKGAMVTL